MPMQLLTMPEQQLRQLVRRRSTRSLQSQRLLKEESMLKRLQMLKMTTEMMNLPITKITETPETTVTPLWLTGSECDGFYCYTASCGRFCNRDVPGTNFLTGTEYRVLRRFFTGSGYRVPGI